MVPHLVARLLIAARERRYSGTRTSTFFKNATRGAAARGLPAAASRRAFHCSRTSAGHAFAISARGSIAFLSAEPSPRLAARRA